MIWLSYTDGVKPVIASGQVAVKQLGRITDPLGFGAAESETEEAASLLLIQILQSSRDIREVVYMGITHTFQSAKLNFPGEVWRSSQPFRSSSKGI